MEYYKRPGSKSPPAWQRQSFPAPLSAASRAEPPTVSSQSEPLKADHALQPIPAPAYVDLGGVKPEKDVDARKQPPTPTSQNPPPPPPPASSSNMYHGPPPPYSSVPAQAAQYSEASLPGSRRGSREDKMQDPPRQSLPSISEALKLPSLYTQQSQAPANSTTLPPSFPQPPGLADAPRSSIASNSPGNPRSLGDSRNPSSLSSFSSQHSPNTVKPPDPIGSRTYGNYITESPRQTYSQAYAPTAPSPTETLPPRLDPLTSRLNPPGTPQPYAGSSLPPPPATSAYAPRPPYVPPPAAPASSQPLEPPHPASTQPGYRPGYGPGGAYSFPPPASSGLNYHESLAAASAQQAYVANADIEKVEEQRRAAAALQAKRAGFGGASYGLTVKRHLDDFELENSLNEVAERTHQVMEFSRRYGTEAHQYARVPLPINKLPSIAAVEDMMQQSGLVTEALMRLRRTVEGMHLAAAAEEQQRQQQQGAMSKPDMYSSYGPEGANHPSYGMPPGQDKLGPKELQMGGGGFAGADAKKRRGRNAPPGRCHSCNRAETPEWRRGPDGARTLCNACGLHYAKLTRKMGVKAGQSGGSNLRPKDGEDTTS